MKTMKVVAGLGAAIALAGGGLSGTAQAIPYSFDCITNNISSQCVIGEAQISMDVTEYGTSQVQFMFSNIGSASAVITTIYWDFGASPDSLNNIASLVQADGVKFTFGSGGNLPGGNTVDFSIDATVDADSPAPKNGVGRGETLGVIFDLATDSSFDDVIAELDTAFATNPLSNTLRVGLHVQSIGETGGSEAFINKPSAGGSVPPAEVPEPGTLLLFGAGLLGAGLARARRKNG